MEEVSSGESALQTRPPLLSAGTSSFSVHPAPAHTYPGAASLSGSLLRLLPLPVEYGPDLLRYIRPHVPPLPVSEAVSGLPRAEECLSPFSLLKSCKGRLQIHISRTRCIIVGRIIFQSRGKLFSGLTFNCPTATVFSNPAASRSSSSA